MQKPERPPYWNADKAIHITAAGDWSPDPCPKCGTHHFNGPNNTRLEPILAAGEQFLVAMRNVPVEGEPYHFDHYPAVEFSIALGKELENLVDVLRKRYSSGFEPVFNATFDLPANAALGQIVVTIRDLQYRLHTAPLPKNPLPRDMIGTLQQSLQCLRDCYEKARRKIEPANEKPSSEAGQASKAAAKRTPEHEQPAADDPTAYRPAKEFLDHDRFPDYKSVKAALSENPWVRTWKPSKQRLRIHAGDWRKMLNQAPVDPLDMPAEIVDAVLQTEQRKAEIRRQQTGK